MWVWDSRTHQYIVAQALQKCYEPFVNMLEVHQELFILGIQAPDRIFKDYTNHYYNCTPNKYGYHFGKVKEKITYEIDLLNNMITEPDVIHLHSGIAPFLESILNTPLKAFIFELGVISHYIADLHQPFHTDGSERFHDEETIHKILEADTRKHLDEFHIELDRRHRIDDPMSYFAEQINFINGYYDALVDNYYLKKGKVKLDRWERSSTIINDCLQLAAQNIANLYLSYERSNRVFKTQINHAKLLISVNEHLKVNRKYYIRKYRSGTISIRYRR